jgi:hypothetical protein
MQAIKRASAEVGELDGVTTFCELAVPLASRLAEKLGLPHNSPQAVDNARDKVGPVAAEEGWQQSSSLCPNNCSTHQP